MHGHTTLKNEENVTLRESILKKREGIWSIY
jgi:hypothetical protein